MDAVSDIKARISIDQLVGQYVQLQKKGRNFVGLCPFHHDSKPSFLVSPDKGICYCFPCQKGGDIFSFYQLVEGVDFKEALKNLAEQAGVTLPDVPKDIVNKDEKERARDCLSAAQMFYAKKLADNASIREYLLKRGVTDEESKDFGLGFAPDSFTETYEHLLKANFSRKEIISAGMVVQKDLQEERVHDRFRNRLMIPIHDTQGRIIGFGGRTMGNDDAKYLNVPDGPLYHKSGVLFGLYRALKAMRETKRVVLVEGYFDVMACHRVGVTEAVATCGTALTEEHVKLIKRSVDTVVLCLDSDRAGREAADRGFILCAKEGLRVEGVRLGQKDPADAAQDSPEMLKKMLTESRPFLSVVIDELAAGDMDSPTARQEARERVFPLIVALSSATDRSHYLQQLATMLSSAGSEIGMTVMKLEDELRQFEKQGRSVKREEQTSSHTASLYSSAELTLALFLLHPRTLGFLSEMLPPEEPFALALHGALRKVADKRDASVEMLELDELQRERARILLLYCEENGFSEWSDSIAEREIRHNCRRTNREHLQRKQKEITRRLIEARRDGKIDEEHQLAGEYQQLLHLGRVALL